MVQSQSEDADLLTEGQYVTLESLLARQLALEKNQKELKENQDGVLRRMEAGFLATGILFGKVDQAVGSLAQKAGVSYQVRTIRVLFVCPVADDRGCSPLIR
jgi:hypothetical protein